MNLIKAAELLKGAPDTELTQYLQNPTGDFPEYLVASEIKRREIMREKYAAANQGQPTKTSIIEELLQKDNQQMRQQPQQMPQQVPPEAMGLGAVPPPQGMQLTPSPMMEAAQQPQQFYDGGVVALAEGGSLENAIQEYLRPHIHEGRKDNHGTQSIGINPSIPVGAGSIDANVARNFMSDEYAPNIEQKNMTGRIGGSYPIGEGRLSAGIQGIRAPGYSGVTGYDVGYSDEKNRLMANINPTPHGAALGASYGRQLDNESAINAMLMRDPRGHMSGNLMYTRQFAQGGMVDEIHDYLQGYASGGEVKHFKIGGYNLNPEDYNINQSLIQQTAIPNVENLDFYRNQAETALGPSALTGYQDVLTKQRAEIEGRQKNYLPDFLIQAGLGMAMSKGNLLQAAAEGAAQGFKFHQQSKQADEQAKRNLVDSEFKFKQAERAEKAGLFGLSRDLYKDATGQRNDAFTQNRAAETLRINSIAHRDDALAKAQELGISEERLAIDASRAKGESELRKAQIKNYDENRDIRRQALQLKGTPKPMSGKDKLAAVTNIQRWDPQYAALKASLEKAAKKDPALQYTIQGELDKYIDEQLKKYSDVYTAADLMGSDS